VEEIDHQQTFSHSAIITTTLFRAKLTLEQLNHHMRLSVNGASRIRRRAWTRNKSKVYKLQATLKEHRANLLAATSANSL